MNSIFTFREQNYLRVAACVLLIFNTSCGPKADDKGYGMQLSADASENAHLRQIVFSRNKDSIGQCADADYTSQKYYIFWTGEPSEVRFNTYLTDYARKHYNVILIACGCKNRVGAYYYNGQMAELFARANKKPLYDIYIEAKDQFNKTTSLM